MNGFADSAEPIDRAPVRLSSWLSITAGFTCVVFAGQSSAYGLAGGTLGVVLLSGGLFARSARLATIGAAILVLASLLAGVDGATVGTVLVSATAGVLAWDFATTAIDLGAHVGRETDTRDVELLHASASAVAGVATVSFGYVVYLAVSGTQPTAALVFLLCAAIAMTIALR